MATSEGFVSTPLEEKGARHKDSYFPLSDENASKLKDTDAEFKRLKADFLMITRNKRRRKFKERILQKPIARHNVRHNDDQQISQNLKSQHSTQPK